MIHTLKCGHRPQAGLGVQKIETGQSGLPMGIIQSWLSRFRLVPSAPNTLAPGIPESSNSESPPPLSPGLSKWNRSALGKPAGRALLLPAEDQKSLISLREMRLSFSTHPLFPYIGRRNAESGYFSPKKALFPKSSIFLLILNYHKSTPNSRGLSVPDG